jgi:putative colanic acid biosynthesis UDP-glucose lipid carrier transferase
MNFLRSHSGLVAVIQRLLDAGLIAAALYATSTALEHEWNLLLTLAAALAILVFGIVGEARRLYSSWRLATLDEEYGSVFVTWSAAAATVIVAAFLAKVSSNYSRLALVSWFLVTPALLIGSRFGVRSTLRWLRRHGRNTRTVGIAGAGAPSRELIRRLQDTGSFGVRFIGVFDDRSPGRISAHGHDSPQIVGTQADLVARARRGELDYVFIALPLRAEERIVELVSQLADTTASVYIIPDMFTFDLLRARWTMLSGLPAVSVYESPFDGLNAALKRGEDLVLGSFFLALAAVPMLCIALGVRLSMGPPVLFRQRRYGLNGKVVEILKFRTMTVAEDGDKVPQALQQDSRATPFGRFLRAYSLDELPQLFNVLAGSMSLVGPRPHAIAHNEEYRRLIHGYMLRHKVKPGMTGWAQVNGWRGQTDTLDKMQKRVEHDLDYVQNWSIWLDLRILLRTVGVVLSRRNAH